MRDELVLGIVIGLAMAIAGAGVAVSIYQQGHADGLAGHHDMVLVGKHACDKCKEAK